MKKLLILIPLCLVLFGFSNNGCDCNKSMNSSKIDLQKYKTTELKVTGIYDLKIDYNNLKKLTPQKITSNTNNPLYNSKKVFIGFRLLEAFKEIGMKQNFKSIYITNGSTKIKYTKTLINNSYIIFYENGYELKNPKIITLYYSDIYWLNNVNEIIVSEVA
jgi:hypothetical protein